MEYTSKLTVTELPEGGYSVRFAMNNTDKPLIISGQLGASDFLKYVEQELKDRCLWRVEYSLGYQSFPESCPESPEQTKCKK